MPASEKSNTLMLQLSSDFMIQSMWCQQLNWRNSKHLKQTLFLTD
jgi:hypothetical protein